MHYALCVIGNPIAHSQSPIIHQTFAQQLGLSLHYQKILAPLADFESSVHTLRKQGLCGANVTLPFKERAFALATQCSARASRAKSANTLWFKDAEIYADNTDGIGLVRDIQVHLSYALAHKNILVCGAGGAVRGILYPILMQRPQRLTLVNRDVSKAQALAQEFADIMPITVLDYQALTEAEFDVIIDGTAFSTEPLPLSPTIQLSANSLCYDLKYSVTGQTHFLSWASQHGATLSADGIGMLIEQAAESFALWTGLKPETQGIRQALQAKRAHPLADDR